MDADFSDETWRYILLPVYIAAYRYDGKLYRMMINGQTGAITGSKPVVWAKVWLAIIGSLTPGVLLALIGFVLAVFDISGTCLLALGFLLLGIGVSIGLFIHSNAKRLAGE